MRLSINEDWFAVVELLDADGRVVRTIPIGFLEPDTDYTLEGIETEVPA